jgi:chromosome condensin MukBEF complex kleisin-like MukF subunit
MYKFGWKTSKYIHYYSEFLGMKDTIRNEDLYVDITKTELENEIKKLKEGMKKQTHIYSTEMERAITDMERTKAMLHEFTSELAKKTGIDLNTLKQMVKN